MWQDTPRGPLFPYSVEGYLGGLWADESALRLTRGGRNEWLSGDFQTEE